MHVCSLSAVLSGNLHVYIVGIMSQYMVYGDEFMRSEALFVTGQ